MTELFKTISKYHFFNYLLPGAIGTYYIEQTYNFPLEKSNIIVQCCIYYLIGLLISRIGALIISPILKHWIHFQPYDKYLCASKMDPTISAMSTIANMYRTISALLLIFSIAEIVHNRIINPLFIFSILGLILLILSYIKQTLLIVKRIEIVSKSKGELKNVEK